MKILQIKRVSLSYPFLVLLFFSSVLYGQEHFLPANIELQAYNATLQLQPDKASTLLAGRTSPSALYFAHFNEFVDFMINENLQKYDQYERNFENRLSKIAKIKSNSPYKKFYLSQMHLQWALVYLKVGQEFSAGWEIKKAYKLAGQNLATNPDFLPQKYGMGVMQVMLSAVPQKYHWIMGILGLKTSFDQGIMQLNEAALKTHVFQLESKCVKVMIDGYMLGNKTNALKEGRQLIQRYPNYGTIEFLYLSLLSKNNAAAEAIAYSERQWQFSAPIFYYLQAEFYMQGLEFKKAITHYNKFLNQYKGINNLKDCYYKLGVAYKMLGYENNADLYFQKSKSTGSIRTEADKYANRQLQDGFDQDLRLLKVRLLTDGGYLDAAQDRLQLISLQDLRGAKLHTEYFYRKARVYHKLGNILEAERYYRKTISLQSRNAWYFAPNSCLQLGYIMVAKSEITKARQYFLKALSYKKHEYKNSIDNKAKSAINLLNGD